MTVASNGCKVIKDTKSSGFNGNVREFDLVGYLYFSLCKIFSFRIDSTRIGLSPARDIVLFRSRFADEKGPTKMETTRGALWVES